MNAKLALINLCIQAALIGAALVGLYLAKRHRLKRHCLTMRASVGLQILAVIFIMAPATLHVGYAHHVVAVLGSRRPPLSSYLE